MATLTIDNHTIEYCADVSVLNAARAAGVCIPTLCSHPDLPVGRGAKPRDAVYRGAAVRYDATSRDAFGGCELCREPAETADRMVMNLP